ncbi:hypothetical protein ACTTAI_06185 [Rhodobacter capsulatus]|uniref:hypothetical protein n=1 Tax=Rhodobacter capsulatus TaxID=1061 RepID=UPI00402662CC
MSRRSLTRHIRARTGGSFGDWLRQVRLARAQEMLAAGARGAERCRRAQWFSERGGAAQCVSSRTRSDAAPMAGAAPSGIRSLPSRLCPVRPREPTLPVQR